MATPTPATLASGMTPAVKVSAAWCAAILVAVIAGAFRTPGDQPPIAMGLAVVTPPAIAIWFTFTSERFRA